MRLRGWPIRRLLRRIPALHSWLYPRDYAPPFMDPAKDKDPNRSPAW